MQIVFNRVNADQLREKYTVLELEAITVNEQILEAFCVVPVEHIAMEMATLEYNVSLHEQLVSAIKENNTDTCISIIPDLMGKFGGELDSFYEIVLARCKETGSTKLTIDLAHPMPEN
jgi:hypothetical protein